MAVRVRGGMSSPAAHAKRTQQLRSEQSTAAPAPPTAAPAPLTAVPDPPTVAPAPPTDGSMPSGPLVGIVQQLMLERAPLTSTVIGITSALPGEGKTTIAAELASGLGQHVRHGGNVLLLDCRLTPEVQARRGWRFWRRKKSRPRHSLEEIAKGLPVEHRSLASVLESSAHANGLGLHDALQSLREGYRFIVLDLAALLEDPTSSVVAREADRLYLVVRANATDAGSIRHAIEQLDDEHRRRIEGVILNHASGGSRL